MVPYYSNLPRERMVTWNAQLAYLLCVIVSLEGIILIGTYFKLGSAGITPYFRLHPEAFALPFLSVAFVLFYVHL